MTTATLARLIAGAADFTRRRPRRLSDPNAVREPDARIMEVLFGLMGRYRKTYCYPGQVKLLKLLKDFTGRPMAPRTLCRHMKALERSGHVRRLRRYGRTAGGEPEGRTTLYWPGGRWLGRARRAHRAWQGYERALDQRAASRLLPHTAANKQPPTAVEKIATVDKSRAPPE